MSGAEKRPETTTEVSEKHQTSPIFDHKWLVETILFFVLRNRTSNTFVTGRGREILVEHEIRDMVTRFGP